MAPACLPTKQIAPGSKCYTSGWGSTVPEKPGARQKRSTSNQLKAVELKILSQDKCEDSYHSYIHNVDYFEDFGNRLFGNYSKIKMHENGYNTYFLRKYEICVKAGSKGSCHGDSGGPLICKGF